MGNAMVIIKWVLFVGTLLLKYGPDLIKQGKKIYDEVEKYSNSNGKKLASEEKAEEFDKVAKIKLALKKGGIPKEKEVTEFRENIWKSILENFKKIF